MLRRTPTDWRGRLASQRYSRTKQDQVNRCQSPTPVTRRKKPRSSPFVSHSTHVLARQSSPPPQLLQAPSSLLKSNKKRISRQQSDQINAAGSGHSSSESTGSSTKSRKTSPPQASSPFVRITVAARCQAFRRGRSICGGPWTPASGWRRGYRSRVRIK